MKVSIIMPVYQVSDYVERCLLSVMKQDYENIECIIIDDATKDDSIIKCEKLIENYKGPICFKIIHHPMNRGVSAARNTGTDAAIGDYLYYLDSDDEITSDCIGKLVAPIMEDSTIEMVQGNFEKRSGNDSLGVTSVTPMRILSNKDVRKQYLKRYNINTLAWNKLLKRSFILNNKIYFKEKLISEDHLWMFYLIKYLENVYICNDVTYYYYYRPGSLTSTNKKIRGEHFQIIFNDILNHLTTGKEKEELRSYLYKFSYTYLLYIEYLPSFKEVLALYQKRAKQHGCLFVYFALFIIGIMGYFGASLNVLKKLNNTRKKINRKRIV